MPLLTRTFLRTAILYFVAALVLGLLLAARPWLGAAGAGWLAGAWPVYWHLFMFGWVTQLIMGIALWMFPRYSKEQPRGNETLAWIAYGCINLGLLLRLVAEPALAAGGGSTVPLAVAQALTATSALLQAAGGLLFVLLIWPRVKGH